METMTRTQHRDTDEDFERYKILLDLWSRENPIKTTKLQVLLAVNALLISVVGLPEGGLKRENWFVYAAGFTFSLVWTMSIGRTALFQEAWNRKLNALASEHPEDPRFSIHNTKEECAASPKLLRVLGGVPSKWYLLFAPPVFALVWILILLSAL